MNTGKLFNIMYERFVKKCSKCPNLVCKKNEQEALHELWMRYEEEQNGSTVD